MSDSEIEFDPGVETLAGDLTGAIIDRIRALETPFKALTESQQKNIISDTRSAVRHFIRRSVQVIAEEKRAVIVGNLDQVTAKDGFKAVVSLPRSSEFRHELVDSVGKDVLIVVTDAEQYMGGEDPETDVDEPALFDKTSAGRDDEGIKSEQEAA